MDPVLQSQPNLAPPGKLMDRGCKDENSVRSIRQPVILLFDRVNFQQLLRFAPIMRKQHLVLVSFQICLFASLARGVAKFKPSVLDSSPWLPLGGEATRNLWQPLLEKLSLGRQSIVTDAGNQGRQSKSIVNDAQAGEQQEYSSLGPVANNYENVTTALLTQNGLSQIIFDNIASLESKGIKKIHNSLKRRKKSEKYGARIKDSKTEAEPVHRVFPNDPKYPSDHDFKEDPIFVILNSSNHSVEERISRSPFIGAAEFGNR